MPVLDHEVHPSTKRGADHRYGCWNLDRAERRSYEAPDRNTETLEPGGLLRWKILSFAQTKKFIANTMSTECRYDRSLTDPQCSGCKHAGSGEAYAAGVRGDGESQNV